MASTNKKNGSSRPPKATVGKTQTITASATLGSTATVVFASSASGAKTLTLPAAAKSAGREVTVVKTGASGTIVIDPAASEQIDGASTFTLTAAKDTATIVCNGTAWYVTAKIIAA